MNSARVLLFGIGPHSDHTILYLDLSLVMLSAIPSDSLHDPMHPAVCNLWSTDIKAIAKYTNLVCIGFEAKNIAECIPILINHTGKCTDTDERIFNKIDKDIICILLTAERDCKIARGHTWLPPLAKNAGEEFS